MMTKVKIAIFGLLLVAFGVVMLTVRPAAGNEAPKCETTAVALVEEAKRAPNMTFLKLTPSQVQIGDKLLRENGDGFVEGTVDVYFFFIDGASVAYMAEVDAQGCVIPGHFHVVNAEQVRLFIQTIVGRDASI